VCVPWLQMYRQLMELFIRDDHDHSVCAVSESVQLFTVPTLVRVVTPPVCVSDRV